MTGDNRRVDDSSPSPAALPSAGPAAAPQEPASGREGLVRRLAAPVGALAAVVAGFAYVGAVDPNEPGHYPVCPLLKLTGILCPGCGGLRSAHAFAHGDLAAAFGANALAVLGYGIFAVLIAVWLVRAVRGRAWQPALSALRPVYWWGIGALVLAFTVARNLPFGAVLAP